MQRFFLYTSQIVNNGTPVHRAAQDFSSLTTYHQKPFEKTLALHASAGHTFFCNFPQKYLPLLLIFFTILSEAYVHSTVDTR